MSSSKWQGPGLYEFLIEAELQQYYNALKNDLKVIKLITRQKLTKSYSLFSSVCLCFPYNAF